MSMIQKIIHYWSVSFFTEPLLGIVLCIALAVALKNRKKHVLLKYIPLYITIFLFIIITGPITFVIPEKKYSYKIINSLNEYADYFFTLLEMIIFSHIYYWLTDNTTIKRVIFFVNAFFVSFFLYMLFRDRHFPEYISQTTQEEVYTVEGILLLPICISYFVQLFRKPPYPNLKNEPGFWISAGMLSFLACTLPYSILENYVSKGSFFLLLQLYSIFYIFYILLFLAIIRAYLCKPKKPK